MFISQIVLDFCASEIVEKVKSQVKSYRNFSVLSVIVNNISDRVVLGQLHIL